MIKASGVALLLLAVGAHGCTNYIVTKGASADGSTHFAYAADSGTVYGHMHHYPSAEHPQGAVKDIWDWDSGVYLGQISEPPRTYNVVGNMNEFQLAIGETTFGGLASLAGTQTNATMDYGNLIWTTLQRARTASEAITTMAELVATYGYYSEGESFTIADPNEVWIMEMIGKGPGEVGAVWVASRVPDGYVSGHANQARTRTFPWDDPANCRYSPDVMSFAVGRGLYPASGGREGFSFSDVYDPVTPAGARQGEARVWMFFQAVAQDAEFGMEYLDYARGNNLTNRMPLWILPKAKVSVNATMWHMRTHFGGTFFDMTRDVGAGPFGAAFRVRPLLWEVDGAQYTNERPVGVQQTGWHFVAQLRSWLPDEVGGLLWFGVDDTAHSVHTPMYGSSTRVPPTWSIASGDTYTFSFKSAFWVFNMVANLVYGRWEDAHPEVQAKIAALEAQHFLQVEETDKRALALLHQNRTAAVELLTDFGVTTGEDLTAAWWEFWQYLFVRFRDGFTTSPTVPKHPKDKVMADCREGGYPAQWYERIAGETGDHYELPTPPSIESRSGGANGGAKEPREGVLSLRKTGPRGVGREKGGAGGGEEGVSKDHDLAAHNLRKLSYM